jgi:hypothetical protein
VRVDRAPAVACLLLALTGCAGGEAARPTPVAPAGSQCAGSEARSPGPDEVLVFFACEGEPSQTDLHAFPRPVPVDADVEQRLRAALNAYFEGPTEAEGEGLFAFGHPGTLVGAFVRGDRAVIDVDLDGGLGSTSAQSSLVWASLEAIAFQFPSIETMEPRYNGSCDAFGAAVEAGRCLVKRRAAAGYETNPAGTDGSGRRVVRRGTAILRRGGVRSIIEGEHGVRQASLTGRWQGRLVVAVIAPDGTPLPGGKVPDVHRAGGETVVRVEIPTRREPLIRFTYGDLAVDLQVLSRPSLRFDDLSTRSVVGAMLCPSEC